MDKYEYNVKSDQIKKLYSRKDYVAAAKIADEIDWYRVKDNAMINRVADIYENTKQYEKAKEILLIAYERSPLGRQLAYKLTILALRTKNFVEADEFYQDFVEMSPSDVSQYLLKYRIAKAKGEDIEVLIKILEAYVDVEMDERWQYELAKLYHEAGYDEKCIAMCDELELWFNDGKYVNKAKELKKLITGVMEEYNKRYASDNAARASMDVQKNVLPDIEAFEDNSKSEETEKFSSMQSLAEALTANEEMAQEADESVFSREDSDESTDFYDKDEVEEEFDMDSMERDDSDIDEQDEDESGEGESGENGVAASQMDAALYEEELRANAALRAAEEAAIEAQRAADLAKKLVEEARQKANAIRNNGSTGIQSSMGVQGSIGTPGSMGVLGSMSVSSSTGTQSQAGHAQNRHSNSNDRFAGMSMEEIRRQLDEEEMRYSNPNPQKNDSTIEIFEFDKSKEGKGNSIGDELTKTAEIDIDEIKFNLSYDNELYNTANIQEALAKSMEKLMGMEESKSASGARNPFEEEPKKKESVTEIMAALAEDIEESQPVSEAVKEPVSQPVEEAIPEQVSEEVQEQIEGVQPQSVEEAVQEPVAEVVSETEKAVLPEVVEEPANAEVAPEPVEEAVQEQIEEPVLEIEKAVLPEVVEEPANAEVVPKQVEAEDDALERAQMKALELEALAKEDELEDDYMEDYSNEPTKRIDRDEINRILKETKSIYSTTSSSLLNKENDEQMGLAEPMDLEEQIEGQMTIEEVLEEFEKRKDEETQAKIAALQAEERELSDMETEDDLEEIEESTETDTSETENVSNVEAVLESGNVTVAPIIESAHVIESAFEPENISESETVSEPENISESEAITESENASEGKVVSDGEKSSAPESVSEKTGETSKQNETGFKVENHCIPEDYRSLFNDFVGTGNMEEAIADTLDNLINHFVMDGTSKTNNVIVTGSAKIGKTTLGLSIIKAANRGRNRSGRRVAKVKASVLNKRGVALAMTQILGTDLIIEQAGNLMPNTLVDLMIAMKNYTEEMLIVLEDDKAAIDRMLNSTPELNEFFTNRLDIHEMEINDMVKIAKEYAAEQFYEIDEMGELALYAKLDDISGHNPVMSIEDIQEVIDEAIAHANRFGLGKLFGKIRKGKGEMSTLTEQDFL